MIPASLGGLASALLCLALFRFCFLFGFYHHRMRLVVKYFFKKAQLED